MTLRAGTLFHGSKVALTLGFQAIYLVHREQKQPLGVVLKRHLGVVYSTAWRLKYKLPGAMRQREQRRLLHGMLVADAALPGGVRKGKRGRGLPNKRPFVAAVELDEEGHPRRVRFDAVPDCSGAPLAEPLSRHLSVRSSDELDGRGKTATGRSGSLCKACTYANFFS
jgi:hypothetical protein